MITPTVDELLAELAAELVSPEPPDGAVTITMLSEKMDIHRETVRRFLNKKVNKGEMEMVIYKGVNYYFRKGE